jgi:hypothetical protein
VDIDSKKIASFKWGLCPKLMKSMGNSKCATFNEFISDALTQENNNSERIKMPKRGGVNWTFLKSNCKN